MSHNHLAGWELWLVVLITTLGGWMGALVVLLYSLARSA